MPPVLAALFWIWLLVSVVVLIRRHLAKRALRASSAEAAATADEQAPVAEPVPAPVEAPFLEPVLVSAAVPGPVEPLVDRRSSRRGVPAAGIADALIGIRMPCDLVPLVVDRLATDKIALSTTGYPAEVVGTGLADELERLGYVLKPVSEREVVATRGATELLLRIKPPDRDGRHAEHPQVRDDAVVVEILQH